MSEVNISVESSVAGALSVSGIEGAESDIAVTDGTTVNLTVTNGVGAPGAGNVTLVAGTGITLSTNDGETTISSPVDISGQSLANLSDVTFSSPTSGQQLQYNGTQWVAVTPTAVNTLAVGSSTPQDLGTPAAGTSAEAARADHVHDMPTFHEVTNGTATTTSTLKLDPSTGIVELQGGTSGSARLTFNCESNTHGVTIKSPPHSAAATYTLTLPDEPGTQGQVLTTSGPSGQLSWSNGIGSVGGGVSWTTPVPTSSATTGAPGAIAYDNNYIYVMTLEGWKRAALSGWGTTLSITVQPTDVSVSSGTTANFNVTATGPGLINYQWQSSSDNVTFTDIAGATASSYAVQATDALDGYYYRVVVSSPQVSTPIESDSGKLTVNATNRILLESGDGLDAENSDNIIHDGLGSTLFWSTQPTNATLAAGATPTHTFTAVASDSSGAYVSYQWQLRPYDSHPWTNLAGETSSSLTLSNITAAQASRRYRCIARATGAPDIISNIVYVALTATPAAPIELDPQAPADVVVSPEFTPERSVDVDAPGAYTLELQREDSSGNWETVATDQPNRFSYYGEVGSVAEGTRHGTSTADIEQNELEPTVASGADDPFALGMACDESLLKMVGFDGINLKYYSRPTINSGWASTQTISNVSTNAEYGDTGETITFAEQGADPANINFALHKAIYGCYGLESARPGTISRLYRGPRHENPRIQRHNHLVQMSGDGETLAVSTANKPSSGEIFLEVKIYKLVGGSWTFFQSIDFSDSTSSGNDKDDSLKYIFGKSLTLNHDGTVLALSAPFYSGGRGRVEVWQQNRAGSTDAGPHYFELVTVFQNGIQTQYEATSNGYIQAGTSIYGRNGENLRDAKYGMHLSLDGDGLRLAISAPGPNKNAGYYSNGAGYIVDEGTYAYAHVLERATISDDEWQLIPFEFNESWHKADGTYENRNDVSQTCSEIKEQTTADDMRFNRNFNASAREYYREEGKNFQSLRNGGYLSKDGKVFVGDFDENVVVYVYNDDTERFEQAQSLYSLTEDEEPQRIPNRAKQRYISMSADGSVIAVGDPGFNKVEHSITENRTPIGLISYFRRSFDLTGKAKWVKTYEKTWVSTVQYRTETFPDPAPSTSREYYRGQGYGVAMHKDGTQLVSLRNSAWKYYKEDFLSYSGSQQYHYELFYQAATTPEGGTQTQTYNMERYGAITTGTLGGGLKDSDGQKYRYLITAPEANNSPHASDEFEVDVVTAGTISIQNELSDVSVLQHRFATLDLGTVTASNGQACTFNWYYQPATTGRVYSVSGNASRWGNIGINLENLGGQALRFESGRVPERNFGAGTNIEPDAQFNSARLDLGGSSINLNQWDGSQWYCIVTAPGCPAVRTGYAKLSWLYYEAVFRQQTGGNTYVNNRAEYLTGLGYRLDTEASTPGAKLFCGRNVTASLGMQHKTYLNPTWRNGALPFRQSGHQRQIAYFTLNYADGTTEQKTSTGPSIQVTGYSSSNPY